MAKKKSRKSGRQRQRRSTTRQPRLARQPEPSPAVEAAAAQAAPTVQRAGRAARSLQRSAADFVSQYAYVYFDLRKMFTVAAIMFILLIVANLVLTRMITL